MIISPTKVNLYLKCPRMCLYYMQGVPQKKVEALEYGLKVHEVIAKYYELIPKRMTVAAVEHYVRKAVKEVGFDDSGGSEIDNFIKFEKWRITNRVGYPVAVEKDFRKGDIHGKIDCLLQINNKKIVVDWKTGYRYKAINSDMARQGLIYKYVTDADDVIFIFLTGDKAVWARLSDSIGLLDVDMEDILKAASEIKKGEFPIREGPHCRNCLYNIRCNLDRLGWDLWDIGRF